MSTRTITLPADQWEAILEAVQDHWDEGPRGEGWQSSRLSAASAALSTALAQPEPEALRPDRYELGDAIRRSWLKRGQDSWCSIADDVLAELPGLAQPEPEGVGPITDGRPMNQSYWLALLRHDAYAASFQSVDQYRSALIERASSPRAQPEPVGVGDEELEATARAVEIQCMKEHGGLTASTPDGIHAQLQGQRLAGLRAVAVRCATPQSSPVPVPVAERLPGPEDVDWLDICKGMLHDFDDLVANSDGVSGLHHNGDLATWDELTEGSDFLWIGQFARAREAINALPLPHA